MTKKAPETPLGLAKIPAALCGIPIEKARSIHMESHGMLRVYNRKLRRVTPRTEFHRVSHLTFLCKNRSSINDTTGLFMSLFLVEGDMATARKHPAKLGGLRDRIDKLLDLTSYFCRYQEVDREQAVDQYISRIHEEIGRIDKELRKRKEKRSLLRGNSCGTTQTTEHTPSSPGEPVATTM